MFGRRLGFNLVLVMALLVSSIAPCAVLADSSYSIELEQFRWNKFPLRILVDMNQWSTPNYAVSVHEALDSWLVSIWNYTNSFGGTDALTSISYLFYFSDINSTSTYDVLITFTSDEMPPNSNTVGLTTYTWNTATHEPVGSITINITTFSKTASPLFVKNIAMHEFGHALGLGHASSENTLSGPELMYRSSSKDQIVYPSTLDIYGLIMLYQGNFNKLVQLPSSIPYEMLSEGSVPPPHTPFWEAYYRYLIILAALLLILATGLTLRKTKKPEESTRKPS